MVISFYKKIVNGVDGVLALQNKSSLHLFTNSGPTHIHPYPVTIPRLYQFVSVFLSQNMFSLVVLALHNDSSFLIPDLLTFPICSQTVRCFGGASLLLIPQLSNLLI